MIFLKKILKIWPSWSTFSRRRKIWSFHVVVLQRTTKKCTKNCNARAQLMPLPLPLPSWFRKLPNELDQRAKVHVERTEQ